MDKCVFECQGAESIIFFVEGICMLCVHAGMGGVRNICILMCERAQLGARRRTGMFRGAVGLRMCSDISALESVFPLVRSWRYSWGPLSLKEQWW